LRASDHNLLPATATLARGHARSDRAIGHDWTQVQLAPVPSIADFGHISREKPMALEHGK